MIANHTHTPVGLGQIKANSYLIWFQVSGISMATSSYQIESIDLGPMFPKPCSWCGGI
jgi:hypothetical protein